MTNKELKFIVNRCYGGFNINSHTFDRLGLDEDEYYGANELRYNKDLIAMIENGDNVNKFTSYLKVVELPKETTDYVITDYDGMETVIYVVDGKIHQL